MKTTWHSQENAKSSQIIFNAPTIFKIDENHLYLWQTDRS
ncbi:Hypothetical protein I595_1477 [Croceitalea dokdonensis DOKDO 023]|uniref:Uncharacterized protein n=1 Tax=Croceitalea dokdonensis DOKDO 023 TaxID=1300341 RepID=A0A0P7AWH0_9FLAO|nr:Hypothetical protein I595_1477 [Croceitalea dokdonensis DOKDO 023]